jgi:hypothetical protein
VPALIALARKVWSWMPGVESASQVERRTQRLRCKRCGSLDIWRIQSDSGWYGDFMRACCKKPFECRMCRHVFYINARRKFD